MKKTKEVKFFDKGKFPQEEYLTGGELLLERDLVKEGESVCRVYGKRVNGHNTIYRVEFSKD